ncbi:MAG TPA: glycosyltransferase family 39 protein [Candidatus Limnocylindria bacterium]
MRGWLRGPEAQLVGLSLLVKVLLFGWGLIAIALDGQPADLDQVFAIWNRWDAPHYLDLAIWGYMANDPGVTPTFGQTGDMDLMIVFYPLFPAAIALGRLVFLPDLVAPIVVNTIALAFAVVLLYRVVAREFGERVGWRSVVFLLLFPTGYFLHIGYTESLFLALTLGAFLAARNSSWGSAGLTGGLAALTRVSGLVLIPSLAADAWSEWRTDHRWRLGWGWIGLVAVGFGGYLLLNQLVYGDPFAFIAIQRDHWSKALAWPWEGIAGVVNRLPNGELVDQLVLGWAELAAIVLGLVGTVVAAFRFRPSWAVWMAGNWILFVSTSFVLSVPRYTLVMFPLFAWFGLLAERRWAGIAIGGVSLVLLVWFSARFALGNWAF